MRNTVIFIMFFVILFLGGFACSDRGAGQKKLNQIDESGSNDIIREEAKNSKPSISSEENNNSDVKVTSEDGASQLLQPPKKVSQTEPKIEHRGSKKNRQQPKQTGTVPKKVYTSDNGGNVQEPSVADGENKHDNGGNVQEPSVTDGEDRGADVNKNPEDIAEEAKGRIETYRDEIGKEPKINQTRREEINEHKKRMKDKLKEVSPEEQNDD